MKLRWAKGKMSALMIGCTAVLAMGGSTIAPVSSYAANESVNVWLTTADLSQKLEQQASLSFGTGGAGNPLTINVDENKTYQQMVGFGGTLSDSSAKLIYNSPQRNTIMNNLFNPVSGIGLGFLRQPMGSSDFSTVGNYSYDDMPAGQTDPTLANFSLGEDNVYMIPLLQQAQTLNSNLTILGTPWSPPGWMKANDSMNGSGMPHLNAGAYGPLANYFVKYVQAYAAKGIPVSYVTVTNEPLVPNAVSYPQMYMSAAEERDFIKNNLGPAFATNGIGTKILALDHNWDMISFPETIFSDPTANTYTAGTSWHCYSETTGPSVQTTLHNEYPDKDAFITECSGGTWQNGTVDTSENGYQASLPYHVPLDAELRTLVINGSRNWAKGVILYNLALDPSNGPINTDATPNGCSTCRGLITIDPSTGSVTYNVDYYALGHASKFVNPGAYRIDSNSFGWGSVEDVAFKNSDGSKVLIAYNSAATAQTFQVNWGNEAFSYTLPAGAAVTFTWAGTPGSMTNPPLSRSGWTATASSTGAGDSPSNALDGTTGTRWSTGAAQANGQWFQVDMGSSQTIGQITMDTGGDESNYPRGYEVYASTDGVNWGSPIASNNSVTSPAKIITAALSTPVTARYLKVVQTGSSGWWWSIDEFNVFAGGGGATQVNLAVNPGFEANGAWSQTVSGWSTWPGTAGVDADADYVEQNYVVNAHSGAYKLMHWKSTPYEVSTYQTATGLANGLYTLKAWVQSSGGQTMAHMSAQQYGGNQINMPIPTTSTWTQITISNINVTNGQCEYGFYSNANANNWIAVDDVEFYKQ